MHIQQTQPCLTYRIVSGKCPLLKQLFMHFLTMEYQVISIIKNLFWRNLGRITLEFRQKNSHVTQCMSWFPRILKFEHFLEYNTMEQWLTSIQTYAALFKKNCKLLDTKYSVIIVWRIGWWHQDMQINCSRICYYCHCMSYTHPPSCLTVCLLNKWTKRTSLITILDTFLYNKTN